MAVAPTSSPETLDMKPEKFETEVVPSTSQDLSPFPQPASTPSAPAPVPAGPTASAASENPSLSPIPTTPTPNPQNPVPNSNDNPTTAAPPPPSIPSFAPSFRPLVPPSVPQYPNPSYPMAPSPGIQPPGVTAPGVSVMHPGGAGAMTFSTQSSWPGMYPFVPGQSPATAAVGYGQVPSGYMTVPGAPSPMQAPPGVPPLGIARYPAPYPTFVRPGFPPHPMPPMGVVPQFPRPAIPGVCPVVTPVVRPVVPIVAPTEKPQTTVYVGKIAPTVDNDFLLSLLRLCGLVKSWKRAQDPSDGTPKGFGFCEFESAEGILRAMRLLSKLNIDRQELVLNINQATREYLERYVEKKTEREQLKETEAQVAEKENEGAAAPGVAKQKDGENSGDKENLERTQNFGIVTDEDRDADRDALEKITHMIDERLKMKPLPLPPPVQTPVDGSAKSNSEVRSKSRDGDSDVDIMKSDAVEVKNDDQTTSENKPVTEPERPKTSTPDKSRRHDRSSRERDRELDMKQDKELELERYERDRERVRIRRERERERELQYAERIYKDRAKEWEAREREKEYQREKEKEREKEYQRERRREILKDENESDDDDTRKRRHRSRTYEERRRKRQREKEEDLADRLKEEEEIAEAKRRAIEAQLSADDLRPLPSQVSNDSDKPVMQEAELHVEGMENVPDHVCECVPTSATNMGDGNYINNSSDELTVGPVAVSTIKQNSNVPSRKLGFGLVGSGKRTAVPSVFNEEDDEDADEKKMRPLVPIDYSTEELQAVQPNVSGPSLSLAAAAEFAKRISTVDPKEDKPRLERERNGRSIERLSQKERDRSDEQNTHARNGSKLRMQDKIFDREKLKTDNKKLLDAKQLIDMIPKTKEELFAYEINWVTYDKYELHERMRPWISKKITEFLGEEEPTLVDYIVSSTKDHVQASKMLELLQSILDDEAVMFVLKMWRMIIFEIKKVEAGLSGKSRG